MPSFIYPYILNLQYTHDIYFGIRPGRLSVIFLPEEDKGQVAAWAAQLGRWFIGDKVILLVSSGEAGEIDF